MSTARGWLLAAFGALLLVGAPLGWYLAQPGTNVGVPPDAVGTSTPSSPTTPEGDADPTSPSAANGGTTTTPSAADTSAAGDSATITAGQQLGSITPRPAPPVSVSLPSIGVGSAAVVSTGLDENRAVAIPDDVREVGWYERGPRPGEAGNAFMTSHVDSRTQGRGVLFDLVRTQPGDPITVTHADGTTSDWVVVARERIDKGAYPMDRVFRFDGSPGLVIDTCGGDFDPSTGSYENIDIVYAEPAA